VEYAGVSDGTLIVLAIIAIVPPTLVAIFNWRNHRETRTRIAENTSVTQEVRHQVKNDHGTNLRDDIDGFKNNVERQLTEMSRQLESIESAQGYTGGVLGNVLGDIRKMKRVDYDTARAVELLQSAVEPLQDALEKHRAQEKNK
jgi:hypothetical protein